MPSLFAPHFEDFYIRSSDSYHVKALKLEILASIATDLSIMSILKEFQVISLCLFCMDMIVGNFIWIKKFNFYLHYYFFA